MTEWNKNEDGTQDTVAVRPEDVLADKDLDMLAKARNGELPCPWCERPLSGAFVFLQLEGDDYYAGVRLSCLCGFVEY